MKLLGSNNNISNTTITLNSNHSNISLNSFNTTPSGPSLPTTPPPPQGYSIQPLQQAKKSGKICIGCDEHISYHKTKCENCNINNGHRGYIRNNNNNNIPATPQYPPKQHTQNERFETPPSPIGYIIQDLNYAKQYGKICWHCKTFMNYNTITCPTCFRNNGHRGYIKSSNNHIQCMLYKLYSFLSLCIIIIICCIYFANYL